MNDSLLFLDESGTADLKSIDHEFPVLALVGVLISEDEYRNLKTDVNNLKQKYSPERPIVLHRRDMRKYENGFEFLFDEDLKRKFYYDLNQILRETDYKLISSVVDKESYIKTFGRLGGDPYQIALTSVLERTLSQIEEFPQALAHTYIEGRGRKEDRIIQERYNTLLNRGSHNVSSERFLAHFDDKLEVRVKTDYEAGIEIADLCAYPVARYVLDNNPAARHLSRFARRLSATILEMLAIR